ncbi:MAG: sigma-70 family RNA polymerase sigma factor [Planctomycetes bacterium]|nr:sigma-70 family RNA polymerase sigma factor [Planctomycetota bacterium]
MNPAEAFDRFRLTRDPAMLGSVFDAVADEIYAAALHLGCAEAEADDLVQSTFLTALERAERFDSRRPLVPWLLGILRIHAAESRRRARRAAPEREESATATVLDEVLAKEQREVLQRAIERLEPDERQVVRMRVVEGCRPLEIAKALGRAPGAVRTQIWRALRKLERLMPAGEAPAIFSVLGLGAGSTRVRERLLEQGSRVAFPASAESTWGGALALKAALATVLGASLIGVIVYALASDVGRGHGSDPTAVAMREERGDTRPKARVEPQRSLPVDRTSTEESPAQALRDRDTEASAPLARTLDWRVVDEAGEPASGARVELFDALLAANGSEHQPAASPFFTGVTELDGSLRRELECERLFARIVSPRGEMSGDLLVGFGIRSCAFVDRIVLFRPFELQGLVVDPEGRALAGARVMLSQRGGPTWDRSRPPEGSIADPQGSFLLRLAPGSSYSVWATFEGESSELHDVETDSVERRRELRLQVGARFALRGALIDLEGAPLRATIQVVELGEWNPERERESRSAETDERGLFELRLRHPGTYLVLGGRSEHSIDVQECMLDAAHPSASLLLRERRREELSGIVSDESGAPREGVRIALAPLEPSGVRTQAILALQGGLPSTTSGADGRFSLLVPTCLPVGLRYRIAARLWSEPLVIHLPASDLRLSWSDVAVPSMSFRGELELPGAASDAPAFVVRRTVESPGSSSDGVAARVPAGSGRFEIGPFPVEPCSLVVEAAGFAPTKLGPFEARSGTCELRIQLQRFARVTVEVRTPDGRPIEGLHLALERQPYDPFERAYQGLSDADGRRTFAEVGPGRFRVWAHGQASPETAVHSECTVASGEEARVVLILSR